MLAEHLIALVALTAMEIVLGIDNIVFIAILSGRLPEEQQPKARQLGLLLALGTRLLLLCSLTWIMGADEPIFHLSDLGVLTDWLQTEDHQEINGISIRDLILLGGGLFLLVKSTLEIHERMADDDSHESDAKKHPSFASVLVQIALLDIVFSLDSVITAVGMVDVGDHASLYDMFFGGLWVMITAVILAVVVMMIFAETVSRFIKQNPTLKMLALSFLILIGVMLLAEGSGAHIDKGYIYFAMVFALGVEVLNLQVRRRSAKKAE
ncbi:TerC family protein [Lignipirellula cremea]|uniref:Integral membrane protein TerC family protein n=1 Tax=Lignipirellula cremea TaxID=2528010 RepID=A0A518DU14_9BACT|nr:TerC family protein [Lignipirellula cremea]QDU95318.1 Integral membrane protein TerC family protein [Lignipirellula cremea]